MFQKNARSKKVCVLGFGKTGAAVANLLASKNFKVLISDVKAPAKPISLHENVEVETNGHSDKVLDCAFVVKSPGIAQNAPILKKIRQRAIPFFSEIEIALAYIPASAKVFAVTGTNGKTTTTLLLAQILEQHCKDTKNGQKVFTAGNIGDPLSLFVKDIKAGDYIALEISSYQLEDTHYFKPCAAAILNITPDHVDHHGTMENYIDAKAKIFKFQDKKDIAVLNGSDENCLKILPSVKSKARCFATMANHSVRTHVFYDGDEIIFSSGIRLRPPQLMGLHNIENAMAASLMAVECGVSAESVQKAFDSFKGAPHRIEHFLTFKGVKYINDSKATNVDSAIVALKAVTQDKNVWLIMGGKDKGFSYAPMAALVEKTCKAVLTVGSAAEAIKKDLGDYVSVIHCKDIETALNLVSTRAVKGDICLLSPACASFDQFENYEARGNHFKELALKAAKE